MALRDASCSGLVLLSVMLAAMCRHASGLMTPRCVCNDPVRNLLTSEWSKLTMGMKMDEEVKRWTAKRKSALVLDIIQGKTTVAEASRA